MKTSWRRRRAIFTLIVRLFRFAELSSPYYQSFIGMVKGEKCGVFILVEFVQLFPSSKLCPTLSGSSELRFYKWWYFSYRYLWWNLIFQVNSIPCYTETKSSNAMNIRHGPFLVTQQNECALACSCASQVNQRLASQVADSDFLFSFCSSLWCRLFFSLFSIWLPFLLIKNYSSDDCTVFTPKIPNVECHAYSYDFESRQCKLLGGEQESVSTEQVVIFCWNFFYFLLKNK